MKYLLVYVLLINASMTLALNSDSLYGVWNNKTIADTVRLQALDNLIMERQKIGLDSALILSADMIDFAKTIKNDYWTAIAQMRLSRAQADLVQLDESTLSARKAIEYFQTKIQSDDNAKQTLVYCYNLWGTNLKSKGEIDSAEIIYIKGLNAISNHDSRVTTLVNLGVLYMDAGRTKESLDAYMQARDIFKAQKQYGQLSTVLRNISILYEQQGQIEQSFEYRLESLGLIKAHGSAFDLGLAYIAMSGSYQDKEQFGLSKLYSDSALSIGLELNSPPIIGSAYGMESIYYNHTQAYDKSIEVCKMALENFEKIQFFQGMATCFNNIADTYITIGNFKDGEDYAKKGLELGLKTGYPNILEAAYKNLHVIYDQEGKHKQAYDMYNKFVSMRDSIQNRENDRLLLKEAEKYKYEKKLLLEQQKAAEEEARLKEITLQTENELLENKHHKGQLILGIIGLIALVLLFIGGLVLSRLRLKSKALKKEKDHQVLMSEKMVYWQEEERKRVAHDLHDGLGQRLSLIKNNLQSDNFSSHEMINSIGIAIQEVRNVSEALRPSQLDISGLSVAIEELVEETFENTSVTLNLNIDDISALLIPEREMSVYRIVQEAMNNIRKYANCSNITVDISVVTQSAISLTIADNGAGFNVDSVQETKQGGFGLKGMKERVTFLQGSFKLSSVPNKGTQIDILIPLAKEALSA